MFPIKSFGWKIQLRYNFSVSLLLVKFLRRSSSERVTLYEQSQITWGELDVPVSYKHPQKSIGRGSRQFYCPRLLHQLLNNVSSEPILHVDFEWIHSVKHWKDKAVKRGDVSVEVLRDDNS